MSCGAHRAHRFTAPMGTTAQATSPSSGWMGRPESDSRAFTGEDAERSDVRTPADSDREHFRENPSVALWSEWGFDGTPEGARALFTECVSSARTPRDAAYWAYHVARSSWFLGQGAAGIIASSLGGLGGPSGGGAPLAGDGSLRSGVAAGSRLMAEALQTYRQDLAHINAGTYKAPYDMDPNHRQFNPAFVASKTAKFLSEAASTLEKNRAAKRSENTGEPADAPETKVWMDSPLYPDYYLKTFHWQTDGWLSSRSAEVYETSTETLFLGRQDAMQRTALVPLSEWMREKGTVDGAGAKFLELACGTGRFLTFVRDNYPEMDVTGLDLSPFYLAEARKNGAYWEKLRRRKQSSPAGLVTETLARVGGLAKAAGLPVPPMPSAPRDDARDEAERETLGGCEYVQAQAEQMPFPDASFDAITCVYLLHELPVDARREVAKEAARVLKPGGVLVLADSIQLGDRPRMDKNLGRFGDFNEPYYRSYIEQALVEVFGPEGAGLEPWTKDLCSSTKVLSFRKPE